MRDELTLEMFLDQVKSITLRTDLQQGRPLRELSQASNPEDGCDERGAFAAAFAWGRQRERAARRQEGYELTDVFLLLDEGETEIGGYLQYDAELFDATTIRRWVACFNVVLDSITEEPHRRLHEVSILPEAERQQVLHVFNATQPSHASEGLIHELFEAQVERTPEAVAVVDESHSLSYAQLNSRANQLARYLRSQGVMADQLVALCMERGVDMIVGLLGIWKAGGAYVPLDPSYPRERLEYLLKDAAPAVLLTQERWLGGLPESGAQRVMLDRDWQRIALHTDENLEAGGEVLRPDHLAYVIYTSGSTGEPKGVMVEHRSVVNLWGSLESIRGGSAAAAARVAVNSSFNFDASVQQLVHLLSGRTLYVVPQQARWDAALLLRFLREHKIEEIECTPLQLESWRGAGLMEDSSVALRRVFVGGEAIDARLWEELSRHACIEFHNVYGPTECTVVATAAEVRSTYVEPHIGRPIANVRIYILDRFLQPVPIGASGEIFIAGAGVARGYLRREQLTAARFVIDPFTRDSQAQMYRTGDLGRWRSFRRKESKSSCWRCWMLIRKLRRVQFR